MVSRRVYVTDCTTYSSPKLIRRGEREERREERGEERREEVQVLDRKNHGKPCKGTYTTNSRRVLSLEIK